MTASPPNDKAIEGRYKMALEAIATMYIPVMDNYRVDAFMQKIAKQALEARAVLEEGGK